MLTRVVLIPLLIVGLFSSGCGAPPSAVLSSTPGTDITAHTGTTTDTTTGGAGGTTDSGGAGTSTGGTGGTSGTGGDTGGTSGTTAAGATLAASLRTPTELVTDLNTLGDLQRHTGETKSQQIDSALKRVKAYRMLLGLRTGVTISSADAQLADAAADVCMQLGTLTHTPSQPAGMSDAQYALAHQGAGESNLASGYPAIAIPQSIDFYMDDSDSSNIDRVGHRRWIMSPFLTQTGFGLSTDSQYTATHVFPESSNLAACFGDLDALQPWEFILYPRWGYMPMEYFAAADVAWSISMRGDHYRADGVTAAGISVRPADHDNNPTGPALTIGYFTRSTDNYGCQQPVLIFRPVGLSLSAGQRYRVSVTGITNQSGAPVPLDYWVEFFAAGVTTTAP